MSQQEIPTSEVLNRAADAIEAWGWGRGPASWRKTYDIGICVEGALLEALGHDNYQTRPWHVGSVGCPAYTALREYLGELPWRWNDTPGRTEQEVTAALRACAVIEEVRENDLEDAR